MVGKALSDSLHGCLWLQTDTHTQIINLPETSSMDHMAIRIIGEGEEAEEDVDVDVVQASGQAIIMRRPTQARICLIPRRRAQVHGTTKLNGIRQVDKRHRTIITPVKHIKVTKRQQTLSTPSRLKGQQPDMLYPQVRLQTRTILAESHHWPMKLQVVCSSENHITPHLLRIAVNGSCG
jgi:hypothetical protein